jgi:hypothetical protein
MLSVGMPGFSRVVRVNTFGLIRIAHLVAPAPGGRRLREPDRCRWPAPICPLADLVPSAAAIVNTESRLNPELAILLFNRFQHEPH